METANVLILPDRLERFLSPDFTLRSGPGEGVNGGVDVCAMQAVAWLAGEPNTDSPRCACPVISRYMIHLNDSALFAGHRGLLKPYAVRIVGTSCVMPGVRNRRGLIAADYAVRVFAPIRLRAAKREDWAMELESLPPITDEHSAIHAGNVAKKIRKDAVADADAYAYAAADAYAYAYAAATAAAVADAAADAYAAAYAAAAAAADADADAAAYADAANMRAKALECLDAMIAAS